MFKTIDVQTAYQRMRTGVVYIDVRSEGEFRAGHPVGAKNIPLFHTDSTGLMVPNPNFVDAIRALAAPHAEVLLGCKVGGRSAHACRLLQTHGFTNVINVAGGMLGPRGWVAFGLPASIEGATPA